MWSFLFLCSASLGYGDELRGKRDELRVVSRGWERRKGKG
jgi:hypothetical protein